MTGIEKPPQVVMKEGLETIVETVRLTEEKVTQLLAQHQETARETVKETVAALAAKLATMMPTTPPSTEALTKDVAVLFADCRDTITEGIGALHTQGADVLHALQILQAPPVAPVKPTQPHRTAYPRGLPERLRGAAPHGGDVVAVARWRGASNS